MSEQKIVIPDNMKLVKVSETEYKIVEKKKELPKSWNDFCKKNPIKENEWWIDSFSKVTTWKPFTGQRRTSEHFKLLPNREYAEAILALIQLIQLRDCYRQGWKPNYNGSSMYYAILFSQNKPSKETVSNWNQIFTFQNIELRDEFLNNFKDLIEKIKPLFM